MGAMCDGVSLQSESEEILSEYNFTKCFVVLSQKKLISFSVGNLFIFCPKENRSTADIVSIP